MSLITTVSHGNLPQASRNAYIASVAFQNYLYDYVQTKNNLGQVTSGSLVAPIPGATSLACPAGRILQPNGKKLFPGGSSPGVSTFLVGVYDSVTFLSGYIDPNSPYFAPLGTDKSYQIQTFDANGNIVYGVNPNGGAADQGPPVETLGDGTFGGNVDIAGTLEVDGALIANGDLTTTSLIIQNPTSLTQSTTSTLTANCALGSLFIFTLGTNDNFTIQASNVTPGQLVTFIINDTGAAVTPTITFGNNIRESGSLNITSGRQATMTFIGYSTYLMETGRVPILLTS